MLDTTPPQPPREIAPQMPILSKQTYASPMSFVGATKRILTWADKPRSSGLAVTVWTAVVLGLVIVWALLVCWYVVIFGLYRRRPAPTGLGCAAGPMTNNGVPPIGVNG
jgi:hypothetical protein